MENLVIGASFAAYRDCTVLITGHSGFKGGWLSLMLSRLGAEVHGLALAPEHDRPSLFDATNLAAHVSSSTFADIRDPSAVRDTVARVQPRVIFHAAAQALVRRAHREPVATFDTNILGTAHVLEAVRDAPSVEAVIVITSDKCYAAPGPRRAFREDDPLGGDEPYSASKAGAEMVTAAYRRSFFDSGGPGIASVRSGNVIGGGDWAEDRLVPDIVRAVTAGKPVTLRNPGFVRPWQHVLEPLRGYLMLGTHLLAGDRETAEAWNFGPDAASCVPVHTFAAHFLKAWGAGVMTATSEQGAPHESEYLVLDSGKAAQRLGWRPAIGLSDGITLAADWYQRVTTAGEPAFEVTMEQIERHLDGGEARR